MPPGTQELWWALIDGTWQLTMITATEMSRCVDIIITGEAWRLSHMLKRVQAWVRAQAPEKVPVLEHVQRQDLAGWIALSAITSVAAERIGQEVRPDEDGNYDVLFQINGIALPFVETVQKLNEQLDSHIQGKAQELIEERIGVSMQFLRDAEQNLIKLTSEDNVKAIPVRPEELFKSLNVVKIAAQYVTALNELLKEYAPRTFGNGRISIKVSDLEKVCPTCPKSESDSGDEAWKMAVQGFQTAGWTIRYHELHSTQGGDYITFTARIQP